jgi:RNA polymerase sigma-70 factor (ECF subfamily)
VSEHYDFIWRLLRRLGLDAVDADDAAQQVFLVALGPRDAAIKAGSERSFLFGVALRVCQEFRRKYAKQVKHEPLSLELISHGEQPDEVTARHQARAHLQQILDAMPEDVRIVFILFELEDMTAPQISELVSAPVGTVTSRLRRGRELFQNAAREAAASIQAGAELCR